MKEIDKVSELFANCCGDAVITDRHKEFARAAMEIFLDGLLGEKYTVIPTEEIPDGEQK